MASEQRNIVIIGGGIIGCTTAYFLTRHPSFDPNTHTITILEANSIASGASGKAGGLLALWAYPKSIVPLSFNLHAELAKEHNGAARWGYRACSVASVTAKAPLQNSQPNEGEGRAEEWQKLPKLREGKEKKGKKADVPADLDWLDQETITSYSEMSPPGTTAQVHPYLFTTSIFSLARDRGAKILYGKATALDYTGPHGIKSVTYEDKESKSIHTLEATDVILAAGPWTSHIFPEAKIEAQRAHSVVVKADVSPHAVFTEIELPRNWIGSAGGRRHGRSVNPEMYPRPDGTVYACGETDTVIPLPTTSDLVQCDESRCQDVYDYIASISPSIRKGEILAKQACYLPLVEGGGGPLIGETGIRGLLLSTGHTCWGIQNSCATGKLISEFVFDGEAKSARISMLDPRKFL